VDRYAAVPELDQRISVCRKSVASPLTVTFRAIFGEGPLLAQSGRSQACPLLGDERKRDFVTFRSVDDPERTSRCFS
jgi:hypothetical protein